MTSKRLYFGLLVIIALLFVGLLAGVYGANKLLVARANTLTSLKTKSQALTQQQEGLSSAKEDIQKYAGLEAIAKIVVPQDKNQAEAVREIVNIAAANGVSLASITFPTSSLGSTGVAAGSTAPAQANPVPAATASGNSAANNLTQLTPVKSIPGVYQLPITIVDDNDNPVQYSQLIGFLRALENNRRTAQVSSINLQPVATDPGYLTFTISLNEYIKP